MVGAETKVTRFDVAAVSLLNIPISQARNLVILMQKVLPRLMPELDDHSTSRPLATGRGSGGRP